MTCHTYQHADGQTVDPAAPAAATPTTDSEPPRARAARPPHPPRQDPADAVRGEHRQRRSAGPGAAAVRRRAAARALPRGREQAAARPGHQAPRSEVDWPTLFGRRRAVPRAGLQRRHEPLRQRPTGDGARGGGHVPARLPQLRRVPHEQSGPGWRDRNRDLPADLPRLPHRRVVRGPRRAGDRGASSRRLPPRPPRRPAAG